MKFQHTLLLNLPNPEVMGSIFLDQMPVVKLMNLPVSKVPFLVQMPCTDACLSVAICTLFIPGGKDLI